MASKCKVDSQSSLSLFLLPMVFGIEVVLTRTEKLDGYFLGQSIQWGQYEKCLGMVHHHFKAKCENHIKRLSPPTAGGQKKLRIRPS